MRYSSTSGEKGTEFTFSVSLNMNCLSYLKIKETEEFKQFALRETGTTSSDTVSTSISKDKKTITTVTRVVPQLDLPWMIRKTVLKGQAVEFLDSRQFEGGGASRRAPFTQKFQSLNNISTAAEVLGEVTFARHPEFPEEKTTVIVEGLAAVSIPGMGKQIEKIIVQNLEKTYQSLPKLIDGWNLMGMVEEELTYFPEPEEIAVEEEEEHEEDSSKTESAAMGGGVSIEAAATKAARDIEAAASFRKDGSIITSPRRAAQRAAALRELASKRNNGRARRWVSLSSSTTRKGGGILSPWISPWSSPSKGKKSLFEARERLLARNKKRRRKGLFYYCGGAAFAPVVIFLLIVMCTWFALLVGFLPEVPDLTERSGLSIASVHDESNSISNEVVIEDAKWLGKRRRKNKHENDDDEYKISETSSGGGRSSRSSNGGSGRTRSSSDNANKNECADSNPSCAMWACDGECDANPSFMSQSCPCACEGMTKMKINNPETLDFDDDEFQLHVEWYDEKSSERRRGSIRIILDAKNAPKSSELVRETIRTGACARHSFCGASKCQFNRVENAYGLVQGKFAGIGKLGGNFGKRAEGASDSFSWDRGVFGSIPGGGDDFLIATKNHKEWDTGFTPIGRVVEEDMVVVEKLLALKTEEFVHPTYKTKMAMLKSPLVFYLSSSSSSYNSRQNDE